MPHPEPPHTWAIVTGEYPPDAGGVSDYTRLVAEALAARGENVHVIAPKRRGEGDTACIEQHADDRVTVHRLSDHFGMQGISEAETILDRIRATSPRPLRVLVQYVPHAFAWRAMNLPLCAWIWSRRNVDHVAVMFHEVAYPFVRGQPLAHQLLAGVNRAMAWLVARASQRIFVSIPAWREVLRPLIDDFAACEWTPVPSNLPTCVNAAAVAAVRARYLQREDELLIGHFGTYGRNVAPLIRAAIPAVLSDRLRRGLLIGRGSEELATESMTRHPALAGRLYATGGLASVDAAAHLAACDLLVQLYPDGISSRRSSAMAALPLGVPVVSSLGELSEPIWADAGAVALSPDASPQAVAQTVSKLAHNPLARAEVARRGRQLYFERFDVARTIDALLDQEW